MDRSKKFKKQSLTNKQSTFWCFVFLQEKLGEKMENIKSLFNLAVANNRLTSEQADLLKEKFCREY